MDWILWMSLAALFIGIWHEINRFPATNSSILKLEENFEELAAENEELRERIVNLDNELFVLSNEMEKIKDPEYYQAIEDGDGLTLYEMDKARGNI
ncbi:MULTISPECIES: hypothetical protein [Alteromonas]|jgi:cell division protein FtsB|nr:MULTISPECIES: hypothetical protein [Alteromonas]MCG7650237.1 hypothetical protein [Alteromonas sp. MmMcT2-5]|tara:strand:+ start:10845 stop:11132 length:288 start_codon:yes stop_codon:yes gene_type:complete